MRHVNRHAARHYLFIGEHFLHIIDRATGHARRFQFGDPGGLALAQRHRLQQRHQQGAVLYPQRIAGKARIVGQFRAAANFAEFAELAIIAGGDDDMPIGTGKGLVGHDVGMVIAPALRHLVAEQIIRADVGQHRHLYIQQGHVDVLPLAAAVAVGEGGQNRHRRIHAGHQIDQGHAHLLRAAAGQIVALTGDRHQTTHTLNQKIVAGARRIRPILAKTCHRAIHDIGFDCLQAVVIEAVAFQLADLEVFQHHITVFDQFAQ